MLTVELAIIILLTVVEVLVPTATVSRDSVQDGKLSLWGAKLILVAENGVHLDLITHVLQVEVICVLDQRPKRRVLLELSVEKVLKYVLDVLHADFT